MPKKSAVVLPATKKLLLNAMPSDIYNWIVDEQSRIKKESGNHVGIEQCLYRLIRKNKLV